MKKICQYFVLGFVYVMFRELGPLVSSSKTVAGKCLICKVAVRQLKITLLQRNFSRFVMRLISKIVQQSSALNFCFRFLIRDMFRYKGLLVSLLNLKYTCGEV